MIRISVVNEPVDRWAPVIGRCFRMTLAPLDGTVTSLSVQLRAPASGGLQSATYCCEVRGRTTDGLELHVTSAHEQGSVAISHAFTRAQREVRRRCLRGQRAG